MDFVKTIFCHASTLTVEPGSKLLVKQTNVCIAFLFGLMLFISHKSVLFSLAISCFLSSNAAIGASLTPSEDIPFAASWAPMRTPKWSNGALLTVQYHNTIEPIIWIFDRTGQHTVAFTIPGAKAMLIYDWDRGVDGTLVVSGSAADADGRAGTFLAVISSDGRTIIIRMTPYRPARVAVAPDGTFWTVGAELAPGNRSLAPAGSVIHHLDRSGNTLGVFIGQSTIKDDRSLYEHQHTLRVSRDRVIWYSYSDGRYVEISLAGKVLLDAILPLPGGQPNADTGFAVTEDNQVFINAPDPRATQESPKRDGIYVLDRSTFAWIPVPPPTSGATFGYIYGTDSQKLVTAATRNMLRLFKIQ